MAVHAAAVYRAFVREDAARQAPPGDEIIGVAEAAGLSVAGLTKEG